ERIGHIENAAEDGRRELGDRLRRQGRIDRLIRQQRRDFGFGRRRSLGCLRSTPRYGQTF
ncbi:hypothetical protein JWG43_18555, partial [Desulfobulbus alkaliphilus]